jgi:hypothetical protein
MPRVVQAGAPDDVVAGAFNEDRLGLAVRTEVELPAAGHEDQRGVDGRRAASNGCTMIWGRDLFEATVALGDKLAQSVVELTAPPPALMPGRVTNLGTCGSHEGQLRLGNHITRRMLIIDF